MSSRSNGVTKVELTRLTIAWVVSSARCSASRMRSAMSVRSASSPSISARMSAPSTRWVADSVNRS